jgi:hypothetical protein
VPKGQLKWFSNPLLTLRIYKAKKMKKFLLKWYPVIIAFACMMYSISLGLAGMTDEAQYSAHWPGTILLFSIAINQINRL